MDIRKLFGFKKDVLLTIKKQKPGHGPCCTCQECGYYYDECACEDNHKIEAINYVEQLESRLASVEAENKKLKEHHALFINEVALRLADLETERDRLKKLVLRYADPLDVYPEDKEFIDNIFSEQKGGVE